jgi:AraC family 4-hydroxyphenylacetate 3-monooxygenase operon regulatory protein
LRVFLNFCDLVEAHFRDHLTLTEYASRLSVTEPRLNDICRRMADLASKEVVHERLVQEARRLLRYSAVPVTEISYQLGFADPAYFSRFFTKRTGVPPSQFRREGQG